MMVVGLMFASCGLADTINLAVTEIVQEATSFAFDEMGGGLTQNLAIGDFFDGEVLYVNLINNAVSIEFHDEAMMRIDFSPPTTGEYVVPVVNTTSGRVEITDPPNNISLTGNNRNGVLTVYIPRGVVAGNMELRTTNGAVRILGNNDQLARSVEIVVTNGMVDMRDFSAGNVAARSTNGTVGGNGLTADELALNTTNGVVNLRNSAVTGDLTVRTTNGSITVDNVDADMDNADIRATNGVVTIR